MEKSIMKKSTKKVCAYCNKKVIVDGLSVIEMFGKKSMICGPCQEIMTVIKKKSISGGEAHKQRIDIIDERAFKGVIEINGMKIGSCWSVQSAASEAFKFLCENNLFVRALGKNIQPESLKTFQKILDSNELKVKSAEETLRRIARESVKGRKGKNGEMLRGHYGNDIISLIIGKKAKVLKKMAIIQ
jgi:hypothetical protein